MQNFDLHMHTTYCDGLDPAETMVLSAIEKGLAVAGISGHSFTPHDQCYCMSREGTERYIEEICALKQKYADSITLLLGTELDIYADIDLNPYDYYIGSVHYIFSEDGKRKRDEILARHAGGAACSAANAEITASDAEIEALIKYQDWCDVDDEAEDLPRFALGPGFHGAVCGEEAQCDDADIQKGDSAERKSKMLDVAELYYDTVGGIVAATDCDIIGHFDLLTKFNEGWAFGPGGTIVKKTRTIYSPAPNVSSAAADNSEEQAISDPADAIFDTSDERYIAAWKKAIDRIFNDCEERYRNGYRNRLEALGVLQAGDKPVFEINTGAITKGYRTKPYPSADQIAYIKSKGGVLILSSDSHAAGTICSGFEEFANLVQKQLLNQNA